MSVTMTVSSEGNLRCTLTHGPSQTKIGTDAPVDNGGSGMSFSPTDLLSASVGACMITIMDMEARKQGYPITGMNAEVIKEMVSQPVRKVKTLTIYLGITSSQSLTEEQKQNLEHRARHCPVAESIHPDVILNIVFTYF